MVVMLSLPPVPEEWVAERDQFVGVWSSVRARMEQAGNSFYERYEKQLNSGAAITTTKSSTPSLEGQRSISESGADDGDTMTQARKKKGFKDSSSISARVRKAIEEIQDLYTLLCSDPSASTDELKRQYKKLALIFHPDKKTAAPVEKGPWPDPNTMSDEEIKMHFLGIQNAFEILMDETTRRQYDSSLPFDDDLPTASDVNSDNFFEVCGPAFKKEAKWSSVKPTPELGDRNTPLEAVHAFYKFWLQDFVSWRDFSNHGEFELEEAQDREERRWMQKENWKVVSKYVKQERQRVLKFVTMAESKDPRILAEKEAERRRKDQAKAERQANLHAAQRAVLEQQKKAIEEAKAAEEAAAKIAADAKKLEKRHIQDLRKRIRGVYRPWCQDTGTLCEFTADDLQDFCVQANLTFLTKMADELAVCVADASPSENPAICEEVAKLIRRVMSEWNASRYKSSFTPKTGSPAEPSPAPTARVWTSEELSSLSKGLVRFPGGTPNRWAKIAQMLGPDFTADDVIAQARILSEAKNLKSASNVVPTKDSKAAFEQSQKRIPEEKKRVDAPPDQRDPSTVTDWTAEQQTALEKALARHPPDPANPQQRWQKIAADVPDKSAKECLTRFKEIREAILSANRRSG